MIRSIRAGMAAASSAVTANRRLFVLKKLCARAVKEGEAAKDPSVGINYLSEKKHHRTAFLTPDALTVLLGKAVCSKTAYLETSVLLGAELRFARLGSHSELFSR